jgi:hypothetical protein
VVRARVEAKDGFPHGQAGSLVDVDLIDAGGVNGSNRPGHGMLANSFRENFTPLGRQQLRIAQTAYAIFRIKNYGGSHNRAKE